MTPAPVKNLRTIAMTTVVFGAVGPAIGSVVRGGDDPELELALDTHRPGTGTRRWLAGSFSAEGHREGVAVGQAGLEDLGGAIHRVAARRIVTSRTA